MPVCKTDADPCDILPLAGEAWSVCLPFGGRIWADGNGVHAQGGVAPPDGVYGKVVIANGCLVGVEPEDVPLYTGSPCAPLPTGCGGESAANIAVAMQAADMPVVVCEIQAGANIEVRGEGTNDDPYIISADTGIFIRSDNAAIAVTGAGTRADPFVVAHKKGLSTTVNGMTFDAFGHLASVLDRESAGTRGLKGLVPGYGINVVTDNATGISTISLQNQPVDVPGLYQMGGYNVRVDSAGRVSSVSQGINLDNTPVLVACGATNLTINATGSVTGIADTSNLGASFLVSFVATDDPVAVFQMRCSSALAGICFTESDSLDGVEIFLDTQPCVRMGKLFWGNGLFLAGEHNIEVRNAPMPFAALLFAVTPAIVAAIT